MVVSVGTLGDECGQHFLLLLPRQGEEELPSSPEVSCCWTKHAGGSGALAAGTVCWAGNMLWKSSRLLYQFKWKNKTNGQICRLHVFHLL